MLEKLVRELRKEERDHIKLAAVCNQAASILSGKKAPQSITEESFYRPNHLNHQPKRKMSAAGRRAISIAQKKRWAKARRAA